MDPKQELELRKLIDGLVKDHAEIEVYSETSGDLEGIEGVVMKSVAGEMMDEWLHDADKAIDALAPVFARFGPDVAIALANVYREAKQRSGVWIVLEGLVRAFEIKHPVIVFQYATVGGDAIPALINYAGRKTWGHIVEVIEDPEPDLNEQRFWAYIHDDNPYRIVVATRNELKWAIVGGTKLVKQAYRATRKVFLAGLKPQERLVISALGLSVDQFRTLAKKGSAEVAGTLAAERIAHARESGVDVRDRRGEITGLPYIKKGRP